MVKSSDKSTFVKGDTITYTIRVSNSGPKSTTITVKDEQLWNLVDNGTITISSITLDGQSQIDEDNTAESLLKTTGIQVTNLGFNQSKDIVITCKVTGDISSIENTASATYGDNQDTVDSNKVTITKDTSGDYKAEKYIVDDNGNILVD